MWKVSFSLFLCITYLTVILCDVSHIYNNQNHNSNQQNSRAYHNQGHHNNYHGQNERYSSVNDGSGWDIRLSVPGEPEIDYPVFNSIPRTSFSCNGRAPGYYADTQARCQVFKVCANTATNGFFSFLCPNGTLFNQQYLVCDWWMNVKCVDTERYSGVNEAFTMKNGPSMMDDIKKMIMYPTSHPYKTALPQMRSLEQVYNPPSDMFSDIQKHFNGPYQNDITMNFKYARPFATNIDTHPSGSLIRNQGNVPPNHNPVYTESAAGLGRQNFNGVSIHRTFKADREEAIKVTKQQFARPSTAQNRQFVVSSSPRPPIIHIPINIPITDYNQNGVSGSNLYQNTKSTPSYRPYIDSSSKTSSPVPFIVLLLQPPFEHSNLKTDESRRVPSYRQPHGFQDRYSQNTNTNNVMKAKQKIDQIKSPYQNHYFPINNHKNQFDRMRKSSNNGSHLTANVASQTNYYITNNLSPARRRMESSIPLDVENIIPKPSRLMEESNIQKIVSSKNINVTSFVTEPLTSKNYTSQIKQIIENNVGESDNDKNNSMVTLFSATIIPSGDEQKQRVIKICIPKDMLSFLVQLHNSTKAALETSYRYGEGNYNKTFLYYGIPFLKKLMEKVFMKSYASNQQVPIATGEEIYTSQKILKEHSQISELRTPEPTPVNEYQSSEVKKYTSFTNKEEIHSGNVANPDIDTTTEKYSNIEQQNQLNSNLGVQYAALVQSQNQQSSNPNKETGGSFYSVQQTNYNNIPDQVNEDNVIYKVTNETKGGHYVSTTVISKYPDQITNGYENKTINYSLKNIKSNEHIESTAHTIVENSAYKETKSNNQFYGNGHQGNSNQFYVNGHQTDQNDAELQLQVFQQDVLKEVPPPSFPPPTRPTIDTTQNNLYSTVQTSPEHGYQVTEDSQKQYSQTVKTSEQKNVQSNYATHPPPKVYSYESTVTHHITPVNQPGTIVYSNHNSGFTKLVPGKSITNHQQQLEEQKQITYQNLNSYNTINQDIEQDQGEVQNRFPNVVQYQTYEQNDETDDDRNEQYQIYNSNRLNEYNNQQNAEEYATVEVVPALGFAFDSRNERQEYYNTLSKGLQYVKNEYIPPYTKNYNGYTSHGSSNQFYNTNSDAEFLRPGYVVQNEDENRLVHGQIIMHDQPQSDPRSSRLEDFGYSRVKPDNPFTY